MAEEPPATESSEHPGRVETPEDITERLVADWFDEVTGRSTGIGVADGVHARVGGEHHDGNARQNRLPSHPLKHRQAGAAGEMAVEQDQRRNRILAAEASLELVDRSGTVVGQHAGVTQMHAVKARLDEPDGDEVVVHDQDRGGGRAADGRGWLDQSGADRCRCRGVSRVAMDLSPCHAGTVDVFVAQLEWIRRYMSSPGWRRPACTCSAEPAI